ncbi:MAG: ATP-binding protein [Acidobacteria bacterium]|nr:ATP-binding protein [Acidobacteriota bacterium]
MPTLKTSRKLPPRRPKKTAGAKLLFSKTFSSNPEVLEPLVLRVVGILGNHGCESGHCTEIELALREALANAILHGNGANRRKKVELDCYMQKDKSILLVVRDQGKGFNPDRVSDPTQPENIYRAGGRGIFLIRHFMDEVEFHRNGAEIHMRKKI